MDKQSKRNGTALTQEQLSDVYAAGTSDGVVELSDGKVKIDDAGYETQHTKENRSL